MEADDNRIETKTAGAQVIDLTAVRDAKQAADDGAFSLVKALRSPFEENAFLWIIIGICVLAFMLHRR